MSARIMADGRSYGAIYADPPWAFRTYSNTHTTPHRCAEDHYSTMTCHELVALPVEDCAAKDCALFMWAADSHLDVAIDLMGAWGFEFKTIAFVWVKTAKNGDPKMGMGYWTRKAAEICLLGTRGKPRRRDKGVRQVIMAPRREHSRKPDEVCDRIERLVGGPYLELFARQEREVWDTWGDETGRFAGVAE